MEFPQLPPDEMQRIAALRDLCLLDTEPEERFDRITRLAAQLFHVPIALISLVDSQRQWFKSAVGLRISETGREVSFCAHAILSAEPLVVEDATCDVRFADSPLVIGEPHVRFYAGHPLSSVDGRRIGTLCIIDRKPRRLQPHEISLLRDLAAMAADELNQMTLVSLQRSVQEAQEGLHKFFNLSLDMLCIADFEGHFTKLNPAWSKTLGYSLEELCDVPFVEFVHPEDQEQTIREAERLTTGAHTVAFENRYRCRDGSYRYLLWTAAPDLEARRIYAVARDVTTFRVAEEKLRRAVQIAEEASQAKSRFLAHMSHEFRTPLNSVIAFSKLLLEERPELLSEEARVYVERIASNGMHLLDLVNDILDLSKIEAGKLEVKVETVALEPLIQAVLGELEVQAHAKGISLHADVPEALHPIRSDPQRLRQILINLVGNAVKFTDQGSVTVQVDATASLEPTRIDIIDTGIGIPKRQQMSVFDAFKQIESGLSRSHGGTGLGLAICKSLVTRLGYRLEVESEVGRGSTFSVVLSSDRTRTTLRRRTVA